MIKQLSYIVVIVQESSCLRLQSSTYWKLKSIQSMYIVQMIHVAYTGEKWLHSTGENSNSILSYLFTIGGVSL